mmetsp:Transcript_28731/g.81010  ORF Transcript_28731/g.81010 Transcript_28731/m.81010 type:complete len:221 (+) Transcript_28731:2922-3584(+)
MKIDGGIEPVVSCGYPIQGFEQILDSVNIMEVRGGSRRLLPDRACEHVQLGRNEFIARRHIHEGYGGRQRRQWILNARQVALVLFNPTADLTHHAQHRLVAMIVSEDQRKFHLVMLGNLREVADHLHGQHSFVHSLGADLNVPAFLHTTMQDVDGEASQVLGKVIFQLPSLLVPEFQIGIAVLPQHLHLSFFDVASVRSGLVDLHYGDGKRSPRCVRDRN